MSSARTMYRSRLENTLKRELLDRGMSADEIATAVRVILTRANSSNPAILAMGGHKP